MTNNCMETTAFNLMQYLQEMLDREADRLWDEAFGS